MKIREFIYSCIGDKLRLKIYLRIKNKMEKETDPKKIKKLSNKIICISSAAFYQNVLYREFIQELLTILHSKD